MVRKRFPDGDERECTTVARLPPRPNSARMKTEVRSYVRPTSVTWLSKTTPPHNFAVNLRINFVLQGSPTLTNLALVSVFPAP